MKTPKTTQADLEMQFPLNKFIDKFIDDNLVYTTSDEGNQTKFAYHCFLNYVQCLKKDSLMDLLENKIFMNTYFDADDCRSLAEAICEELESFVSLSL